MKQRQEINGLRAIAVIPVMLFHAKFPWFSGGYVGVDVFFVISGFLITSILATQIQNGSFSLVEFYERRARRILPALYFVVICCIPLAWVFMLPTEFKAFSQALVAVSFFASNVLFSLNSGYFAPAAELNPLIHTWSLSIEEQFYLFFPILLVLFWRWGQRFALLMIAAITLLSFALSEYGSEHFIAFNFYLLPTRAWELGVGSICALYTLHSNPKSSSVLSAIGIGLIGFAVFTFDEATPFPSAYALLPVIGTALIILFASGDTLTTRLLSTKVLVGTGLISYSAYLWHQPLLAFAQIQSNTLLPPTAMIGILSISLLLAYLTWRFVENPFRSRSKLKVRERVAFFGGMAAALCAFISIGLIGHFTNGLATRLPPEQLTRSAELDSLFNRRIEIIRAGSCQYNTWSGARHIEQFIDQWDCYGNSEGLIQLEKFAIFGDSHSADRAATIRSAGYDILQIGGVGCPLLPTDIQDKPFCEALVQKLLTESKALGLDSILLSNRFEENELEPDYLDRTISFWKSHFQNVYIFSPMPEFYRLDSIFVFKGMEGVSQIKPDYRLHDTFYRNIAELNLPRGVQLIDTKTLFCGDVQRQNCSPIQNGKLMLTDYAHFSEAGAEIAGQRLRMQLLDSIITKGAI